MEEDLDNSRLPLNTQNLQTDQEMLSFEDDRLSMNPKLTKKEGTTEKSAPKSKIINCTHNSKNNKCYSCKQNLCTSCFYAHILTEPGHIQGGSEIMKEYAESQIKRVDNLYKKIENLLKFGDPKKPCSYLLLKKEEVLGLWENIKGEEEGREIPNLGNLEVVREELANRKLLLLDISHRCESNDSEYGAKYSAEQIGVKETDIMSSEMENNLMQEIEDLDIVTKQKALEEYEEKLNEIRTKISKSQKSSICPKFMKKRRIRTRMKVIISTFLFLGILGASIGLGITVSKKQKTSKDINDIKTEIERLGNMTMKEEELLRLKRENISKIEKEIGELNSELEVENKIGEELERELEGVQKILDGYTELNNKYITEREGYTTEIKELEKDTHLLEQQIEGLNTEYNEILAIFSIITEHLGMSSGADLLSHLSVISLQIWIKSSLPYYILIGSKETDLNIVLFQWNSGIDEVKALKLGSLSHGSPILDVVATNSGKIVAIDEEMIIYIWDLFKYKLEHIIPNDPSMARVAIYFRSNTEIIIFGYQNKYLILNPVDGHISSYPFSSSNIYIGILLRDKTNIFLYLADSTFCVINLDTPTLPIVPVSDKKGMVPIKVIEGDVDIIILCYEVFIELWNWTTGNSMGSVAPLFKGLRFVDLIPIKNHTEYIYCSKNSTYKDNVLLDNNGSRYENLSGSEIGTYKEIDTDKSVTAYENSLFYTEGPPHMINFNANITLSNIKYVIKVEE